MILNTFKHFFWKKNGPPRRSLIEGNELQRKCNESFFCTLELDFNLVNRKSCTIKIFCVQKCVLTQSLRRESNNRDPKLYFGKVMVFTSNETIIFWILVIIIHIFFNINFWRFFVNLNRELMPHIFEMVFKSSNQIEAR